jgi:hypothetical protein
MTMTEGQLAAKFKASGRNWDQLCQAAVVNASIWSGGFVRAYASANDAYHASRIVSKDANKAPLGAVHYWAIGKYGHVAGALGGGRVFMASKFVDTKWGTNVGTTTVDRYTKRTGARYLGWSSSNGVNHVLFTKPKPKPAAKPAASKDWNFKLPTAATQKRIQKALKKKNRYYGLVDGDMKTVSLKAVQLALKETMGYKGKLDGTIERDGCDLIQDFAKKWGGYSGPNDRKLGEYSWIGFAVALERGH